jgi:hypothetical protein
MLIYLGHVHQCVSVLLKTTLLLLIISSICRKKGAALFPCKHRSLVYVKYMVGDNAALRRDRVGLHDD